MICLFILCCLAGGCLCVQVHQSPDVITKPGDEAQIFCSHDQTDYRVMLWYQRSPEDTALKLIGYLYYQAVSMEEPYKDNFNISGNLGGSTKKNASLIVHVKKPEQSAVYFCAASGQRTGSEPHFGKGTKLTVLEREVKAPTVTVIKPSDNECTNEKNPKKRKKTLVCVATDFYPDHVSVVWYFNGANVSEEVATDNYAQKKEGLYSITSRLRVPYKAWHDPENLFQCTVNFFDGTATTAYSDHTYGVIGNSTDGDTVTRVTYLNISNAAKLSYGVFIIKSCLYGVFVTFVVWKLQGSKGKQNN